MVKSGLIFAGVALVLATGAALVSGLCAPCVALFLGLAAGYVAGLFDKPASNGASAKAGALAGLIGGAGALVGQAVGAGITGVMVGPEKAADLARQMGLPSGGTSFEGGYWIGIVGSACCLGLLDVALMAGLGALGGLLWWQITGKNTAPVAPAAM